MVNVPPRLVEPPSPGVAPVGEPPGAGAPLPPQAARNCIALRLTAPLAPRRSRRRRVTGSSSRCRWSMSAPCGVAGRAVDGLAGGLEGLRDARGGLEQQLRVGLRRPCED